MQLPPRRETASEHGMKRRAKFAVELFGCELGVDSLRLILARHWALSVCANDAQARDGRLERRFELLAIALGGENLGDPDVSAAF